MTTPVLAILIKVSCVVAVAAVASVLLRRWSAATRHLVWTLALIGVLLLPVTAMVVPRWEIPVRVASQSPAPVAPLPVDAVRDTAFEAVAQAPEAVVSPATSSLTTPTSDARSWSWSAVGWTAYLIGVLALLLRLLVDRWTVGRLIRQSTEVSDASWLALLQDCRRCLRVKEPVRLMRSLERSMPMALGSRRPTILIPAIADTWSDDRRRAVILHELAHVQRRDCFIQLLASIACAVFWVHPGVWFAARRLRVERELACDDQVLAVGTVARDYAVHLLELAYTLGGYRSPALVVSMARPQQLEGRMLAVLDVARSRTAPALRTRILGVLIAAAVVVPVAAAETIVVLDPETPPAADETGSVMSTSVSTAAPTAEARSSGQSRREIRLPGTWELRAANRAGQVYLSVRERPNSMHGRTLSLDEFEGLASSMLSETSSGGTATFRLRRDAGTIVFEGSFRGGVGAGTFDFTPSTTFPAEMTRRGFAAPNKEEQYLLARSNIGFAYLDELSAQKYDRPSLDELVRAGDHGVSLEYLKGMSDAGYRFGQVATLVKTRDHGVTPDYIRGLADLGFRNLSADELVRARDHGVTVDYARAMRDAGYGSASVEELVRARDHGVNADMARTLADLGYERLPIESLVNARDHGVSGDYIKAMADLGYDRLPIEDLVRARDHGVNADFVRGLRDLGYRPSIAELVKARDHGVTADYAKGLRDFGYEQVSIEDLVRLRDHGVSLSFVREQNSRPSDRLTVSELVRRRDRGR